ncbi:MAG TPA: hypothetical protein DGK91_08000 [Clostridium sp.]|nr:hypothetical protein [Clostridium sp.]
MKKAMIFGLAAILAIATACTKKTELPSKTSITSSNSNDIDSLSSQEQASNKISFETVDTGNVPRLLMKKINKLKRERGFIYSKDDSSGYLYIAILMGERSTGGYSIKVVNVEDYQDKIKVQVQEKSPDSKQMVTMALTQPYTVIKVKDSKTNIVVENQSGMKIEEINNER